MRLTKVPAAVVGFALVTSCGGGLLRAGTNGLHSFPTPLVRAAAEFDSIPIPALRPRATFRLDQVAELDRLVRAASNAVAASFTEEARLDRARQHAVARTPLSEMTWAELKTYFSRPQEFLSKHERRGCEELIRLAQAHRGARAADPARAPETQRLLSTPSASTHADMAVRAPMDSRRALAEVARAMGNDRRPPAPRSVGTYAVPVLILDYMHNPIGKGESPAANIPPEAREPDRIDPPASSFWVPKAISAQDLYHGFGRASLPELEGPIWTYAGPKTSYGRWPGFEAVSGKTRIKVKFGETRSEPFTARIFSALGYNAEPTDYAAALKLRYDRRFFREFHLRKEIQTQVRLAGLVRVWTVDLQPRFDPFACIVEAVLKDGSRVPGATLKASLLVHPDRPHPEDDPSNFNREFESGLEYLVTVPANVQVKDKATANIGPWDFEGLGHEDLRELRGAGLLAAWLGWTDSRFENTRLKVVRTTNGHELKHFFSDLGGSLGKPTGPFSGVCESPTAFPWTFTRAPRVQGQGRMTIPFRIVGFQPVDDTLAFKKMTVDDARWMARKIGELREEQIIQALVASGYDSAEVRLYTEKLISRRDRMIVDLGLAAEIPVLRPAGPRRDPGL